MITNIIITIDEIHNHDNYNLQSYNYIIVSLWGVKKIPTAKIRLTDNFIYITVNNFVNPALKTMCASNKELIY